MAFPEPMERDSMRRLVLTRMSEAIESVEFQRPQRTGRAVAAAVG